MHNCMLLAGNNDNEFMTRVNHFVALYKGIFLLFINGYIYQQFLFSRMSWSQDFECWSNSFLFLHIAEGIVVKLGNNKV